MKNKKIKIKKDLFFLLTLVAPHQLDKYVDLVTDYIINKGFKKKKKCRK